jgi:putative ABC transport system ATP-binding protein
MTAPLLELRDLHWGYGGPPVLAGVSLTLAAGEVLALTGPSGSGKSTLLVLAGLLRRPAPGQVFHEGEDAGAASPARLAARRRALRFLFQRPYLLRSLRVAENVAAGALAAGPAANLEDRAAALLDKLGLEGLGGRWPEELSGGQQQRVALARALVGAPRLLLADEPTAALDAAAAAVVAESLRDLASRQGCGVLLTTHDPRIAAVADRRLALVGGRVEAGA